MHPCYRIKCSVNVTTKKNSLKKTISEHLCHELLVKIKLLEAQLGIILYTVYIYIKHCILI